MVMNRRMFMRKTAYYGLGAASIGGLIDTFNLTTALAQTGGPSDYKALVCIFLFGGNDSNNTVVPLSTVGSYGGHNTYSTLRNNLALPLPNTAPNSLVALKGGANIIPNTGNALGSFGFHPSLNGLRDLFDQNRLAVVVNSGTLRFPLPDFNNINPGFGLVPTDTPKQAYNRSSSVRPFSLFAHDQQQNQWRTARADIPLTTGWGGRLADRTNPGSTALPQVISIAGRDLYTIGVATQPLVIGTGALSTVLNLNGFGSSETARKTAFDFLRTTDRNNLLVAATSDIMSQAVTVDTTLNTLNPTINTVFPSGLGQQLRQVASVIKANLQSPTLGIRRQIFFVSQGGYDNHENQLTNGAQGGGINGTTFNRGLFGTLNDSMVAFYNCLHSPDFVGQPNIPADIGARVTAFTHSDFSRTFDPAADNMPNVGSDHAWGSHQFIMGDAVLGGRFYGVAIPTSNGGTGTVFQNINILGTSNNYDVGTRGLFVPSVSVEQVANTLAAWYGLTPADAPYVFPLLSRFLPQNLGFMA